MTVLHTGATKKYVAGWQNIFSGKKTAGATKKAGTGTKAAGKKPTLKKSSKKKSAKK